MPQKKSPTPEEFEELKTCLDSLAGDVTAVRAQQEQLLSLLEEVKLLRIQNNEKDRRISELERRVDELEQYTRTNDVVITGIKIKPRSYARAVAACSGEHSEEETRSVEQQVAFYLRTKGIEGRALVRSSLERPQTHRRRTAEQNQNLKQNQNLRGSVRLLHSEGHALANQLGKLRLSGAKKDQVRRSEGGGARPRGSEGGGARPSRSEGGGARPRRGEGGGARPRSSRLDGPEAAQSVEVDRPVSREESETLRRMLRTARSSSSARGSRAHSPPRQPPIKGGTYDSELMRLLRERDELQGLLDKYERHLSEIQANVRVLSADRDKTSVQYQKAQEEIAHLRREVMKSKSPRAQKTAMTAQSILKRVEAERDEATIDLKRMSTERDSLRERLKISQETAISERAHLEQRVEDLQTTIYTLEQEHRELKSKQALMKDSMMDLEEEAASLGLKLNTAETELSLSRKECSALRLSNNQLDSALNDSQLRLTARFGELQTAQDKNKQLEERNDGLLQQVTGLRDDISGLQSAVSELDQRKNNLQEALERESDLLASTTAELDEKNRVVRSLKIRVEELEGSTESLQEALSGQERELAMQHRKLEDAEQELASLAKMKNGVLRENSLLRDDLDKARLDHQALLLKLEDSRKEAEGLQRRLQEYSTDMSRLEMLLSCKEKESAELQEAQRRALAEAEGWEEQARQTEGALSQLRAELTDSESERRRLNDTLESQELRLQEALVLERSSNGQISQLNHSLLLAEEDLRQAQSERSSTLSDLEKTRQLCVKLDSSKEVVLRELDVCRSEVELLRKQLASERLSMKSLESMLQSTREKELHSALSSQEQHAEIQLLRDKLTMADSKASTQVRELAQLRARSEQLESDLDITKRQLCAERFDRERAVQELRLQGLSSSLRSSSPPRRSLSPRRSWSPDRTDRTFQSSPERLATDSRDRSLVFRDPYS